MISENQLMMAAALLKSNCKCNGDTCEGCIFHTDDPKKGYCLSGKDLPCDWELPEQPVGNGPDPVHHPPHYSWRGCDESLGFIERFISNQPDSFLAFCEGNVFKYLYRYPKKNGVEDLKKAREYLNRMIEHLEDEK